MKKLIYITFSTIFLTSCALSPNKLLEDQDQFKKGEYITLKWDMANGENNKKIGKIVGYKIYHGEESGIYQSCLKVESPITIPVRYVKDKKNPSFKIPHRYIAEDKCYFIISSYNTSGETSASGEMKYDRKQN